MDVSGDQKPRKRKWDVAEPALGGEGAQAGASPAATGAHPGTVAPPAYPPPPMPYGSQPGLSVPPMPALDAGGLDATNPAAIAALATSRLNAMLASKGTAMPVPGAPMSMPMPMPLPPLPPAKDDGVIAEIEINNCPPAVRYLLTKGVTHQEIQQQTGATVISRGRFRPPHEADLPVTSAADRPLYLHVSAATQQEVDNAVNKINNLMKGELPPHRSSREELTAKVFVDIDLAEARKMNFNYVGKIIGPKGAYVKHIESQARARVQLKGRRTDNPAEQAEDDEEMHLLIIANNKQSLDNAKKLSEDLLGTVREDFEEHKKNFAARASGPPMGGYGGGGSGYPTRAPYQPMGAPAMPPYGAPPYGGAYPGYGGYGAPTPYGGYPGMSPYGQPPGAYPPGGVSPYGQPPYGSSPAAGAPPGAEAYAAYGQPYGYGYGMYAGYPPGAAPPQPPAPTGPPGATTEDVGASADGDQSSEAAGPPGANGSTSPQASRRFQEYPAAKKPRPDEDGDELGPKRPTAEEYSTSRHALPEAAPAPEPYAPKYEPYAPAAEPKSRPSGYGNDAGTPSSYSSSSYSSSSTSAGAATNGQATQTSTAAAAAAGAAKPSLPFWAGNPYSQSPLAAVSAYGQPPQPPQQGGAAAAPASSSADASYDELMRELGMGRHS